MSFSYVIKSNLSNIHKNFNKNHTDSQPESKPSLVILCAVIRTDMFACWASSVKMCPL